MKKMEKRTLPKGWSLNRMADVCYVNPPRKNLSSKDPNSLTSFIPMSAIENTTGSITQKISRPFSEVSKGYTYFEDGDILFAKITPCMQNGKSAIAENLTEGFGFGSTEFHVLRSKPGVNKKWIYHFIRTQEYKKKAQDHFEGSAGQQRVSGAFIENSLIPLPPTPEDQSTIANELEIKMSQVEKMRQAALRQKDASEALKGKILTKAFPFKNGDNLPEGWKWKKIINLVKKHKHSIKRGPFGSSIRKDCFVESGFKVYEQKNAIYNNFEIGTYYINKDKFKELKDFELKPDDLIISCSGTLGKIAIAPQNIPKGVINQALLKISLDHEIIFPNYFVRFFESIVSAHMANESRGAAINNLSSVNSIKNIFVPIPATYGDQISISNKIENEMNDTVRTYQAIEKQLEAIQALPAAILREVFDFQEANV